ncbi:MAG TPA: universal stress protein [Dermatophilaceae bacterium]|nr:universal stress protein [Dermatophilaceae bacterium]
MTVLVGYSHQARDHGGLALAAMLAGSTGEPLVVCCVVPDRWEMPSFARVDVEYAQHLRGLARDALQDAKAFLGDDLDTEYVVGTGRSVPTTIAREAAARHARILVLGSSSHGSWGHVALGSVTDRFLHSAELPLALAPLGFRAEAGSVIHRVTVGLDGSRLSGAVLVAAARMTRHMDVDLRVVTFAVRGRTMYPSQAGYRAEDMVIQAWREQADAMQAKALKWLATHDGVSTPTDVSIVDGRDWGDALERVGWVDGDVLVLGPSPHGPLSRVFLGSTGTKILQSSPVPVILIPAGRGKAAASDLSAF